MSATPSIATNLCVATNRREVPGAVISQVVKIDPRPRLDGPAIRLELWPAGTQRAQPAAGGKFARLVIAGLATRAYSRGIDESLLGGNHVVGGLFALPYRGVILARVIGVAVSLILIGLPAVQAQDRAFQFGLMGDTGYTTEDIEGFKGLLAAVN